MSPVPGRAGRVVLSSVAAGVADRIWTMEVEEVIG